MAHFWCLDFPHQPVSLPPCHKLNMIRCREAAPARFWFGFGVVFAKRIKISLTCDFFNSRFQLTFENIFVFGSKHALVPCSYSTTSTVLTCHIHVARSFWQNFMKKGTIRPWRCPAHPYVEKGSSVHPSADSTVTRCMDGVILTLTKNYQIFRLISQGRRSHRFHCGWFKTSPPSRFILATSLTQCSDWFWVNPRTWDGS